MSLRPSRVISLLFAVLWFAASSWPIAVAQVASGSTALVVLVRDRATDGSIQAVTVRVAQGGKEKATGITGANGSITFKNLAPGSAKIASEREGYLNKPEISDVTLGSGDNSVHVTLLAEARDGEYFQLAGRRIDQEGASIAQQNREAFFKREWDRLKLLKPEYQIPAVLEIKSGREYLAKDSSFQQIIKSGRIIGF